MVSGLVFQAFSLSLNLTFTFKVSSMSRTSLGNGMPSSFSHLWSRHPDTPEGYANHHQVTRQGYGYAGDEGGGVCTFKVDVDVIGPIDDNVAIDDLLLLHVSTTVYIFSIFSWPLLLTFHTPLLAIGYTSQSSRETTVVLGNLGWWSTVGDCVSGVLVKSPGVHHMSFGLPFFALLTYCSPLLAVVGDAALALGGVERLLGMVVAK